MNKLDVNKIRNWMYRNARPLDLAKWQYHFEGGSQSAVLNMLKIYQNDDGGFAHALEPDCWNPISSPLQTWTATEILYEISCDSSEVIDGILRYLDSGLSFENNRWLNTIASNNDYPRAPWWQHREDEDYNLEFNPSAALAGFCLKYADSDTPLFEKAKVIVIEAVEFILASDKLVEMHELACFTRLYDYLVESKLDDIVDNDAFKNKLIDQVDESLERDSSKWPNNYVCKPSQLFMTKDSIGYKGNEAVVDIELKFINETRNSDGIWDIPWAWTDYDKEFAISEIWWQSYVCIKNMLVLRNFE